MIEVNSFPTPNTTAFCGLVPLLWTSRLGNHGLPHYDLASWTMLNQVCEDHFWQINLATLGSGMFPGGTNLNFGFWSFWVC